MNILIVEDEPVIAQRIQRMLNKVGEAEPSLAFKSIHWVNNLDDAESFVVEQPIDLVFLDLNLNGKDGFQILEQYTAQSFHTIIISAYAERAITAFEYGVIDFIEKPFTEQRFVKALKRVTNREDRNSKNCRQLAVKRLGEIELVATDQIVFIKSEGHYSELTLATGQKRLHDKSIEKLLQLLPDSFVRTHRSYAVNWHYVNGLSIESGGKYQLNCGELEVPVSRSHIAEVKQKLG